MASGSKWAEVEVPSGSSLYIAQADISNYFYHLGIDARLGRFFSLPGVLIERVRHMAALPDALRGLPNGTVVSPHLCV
eukprot:5102152-Lingulodinium_polyedra.AAC.1